MEDSSEMYLDVFILWPFLSFFAKKDFIIDVWQDPKYTSVYHKTRLKKLRDVSKFRS